MAQNYFKRNGVQQPINIIPDGSFKCSTCNKLILQDHLQDHLSTHVKPKFLLSKTFDHNPSKLAIPSSLLQDINTQDSDMNIKSISPEQLPLTEKQRKTALLISDKKIQEIDSQNDIVNPQIKVKKDERDLSSQLGIHYKGGQQQIDIIEIQTALQITSSNKKVTKKKISLYKSQPAVQQFQDFNSSKKKEQIGQNRQILEYELAEDSSSALTLPQKQVKTVDIRFSTKQPRNSVLINTNSIYKAIDDKTMIRTPDKPFNVQDDSSIKKKPKIGCDNKCPCCQGFYCSVCKSNIPPKYRPVQVVSPQQEKQIRDFYRRYYHPPCRNCDPQK